MSIYSDPSRFAQKIRIPANIVHIAFPLLCWALLIFKWSGFWLMKPWISGITIFYYALAVIYLVFSFTVRMRVVDIIGLFTLFAASLFMWIPYHWILAILLLPALFMAFYNRGNKNTSIIISAAIGFFTLLIIIFSLAFHSLNSKKYAYHPSYDARYLALEYSFSLFPISGTDIILFRVNGPLLIKERVLYLANYSDFGKEIAWLDDQTILIYGDRMDVVEDPTIENYDPF